MGFELDQLELLSPHLPPVRTSAGDGASADNDGCATPTSAANVLRAAPVCPPAPRKPRPVPARVKRRKHCYYGVPSQAARYYWIIAVPVQHDLAGMFVARRPSTSPSSSTDGSLCRPPAGKKIRVHVVG